MFNALIYNPLYNALAIIYNTVAFHDLGIAIIVLTIVVRIVLYPLFHKMARNQTLLQKIQPRVKEIQHTHRENKEKLAQELLALYREHKINPLSSFLALLIQLPILFVLFSIFSTGFTAESASHLYSFVAMPRETAHGFFGLLDLHERSIFIAGIVGAAQFIQGKLSLKISGSASEGAVAKATKNMIFIMPIVVFLIGMQLPAAVGLYYATTTIFGAAQQWYINRSITHEFKAPS